VVCTHRSLSVNVIRVLTQISGITREQSRHCIVIWACSLLWIMSACNRCNLPCKLMLHYYTVLYHFAQLFGRCCYLLLNWMWNAYVLSYVHCNNAVVVFLALRLSSSFGFGLIKFQNLIFAARCRPTWAQGVNYGKLDQLSSDCHLPGHFVYILKTFPRKIQQMWRKKVSACQGFGSSSHLLEGRCMTVTNCTLSYFQPLEIRRSFTYECDYWKSERNTKSYFM